MQSNAIPFTTVSVGNATLNAATFTDTLGTLNVTASATINLGAGASLAFASSNAIPWTGTLNLTGTFISGSSLRFGTSSSGLTSTIQKSTDLGITNPWAVVTGVPPVYVNDGSIISFTLTPGSAVKNFLRLQVFSQ